MLQAEDNKPDFPAISQFETIGWLNRLLPAPDSAKVERLARWFCLSMQNAGKTHEGDAPDQIRPRLVSALECISQLLNLFDPAMARDVASLRLALADLDRGVVHPTLTPKPIDCRPPEPTETWQARAYLALAVDALHRLGMSPLEAARHVLKDSDWGISPATLVEWRKQFGANGGIKHKAVKAMFATMRRTIANLDQSRLEAYAFVLRFEALRILDRLSGVLSPHSYHTKG
jgi:hypothetical protein